MAYRQLTVGGKKYNYVIGTRYVKIKKEAGSDVVLKSNIGCKFSGSDNYLVTPKMIRDYIVGTRELRDVSFYVDSCKHDNRKLRYNPFKAEIHEKYIPVNVCDCCYNQLADDI